MKQKSLPLPGNPDGEDSLRATYHRSGLPDQGISFEEAMKNPAIRTCLINTNHARLRTQCSNERGKL